ncbi:MAG: ketoacyl-ACP synthase III [Mucilaginibacter sp.]|uniref:3-oxoacyl-ACP synthase III family protein n=1 Tax=Mucilaginibacter sp. TaxID=1882438 RepID=UPI003267C00F
MEIRNVAIKGVAACVPATVEENAAIPNHDAANLQKLIKTTGVERRHIAGNNICTSDLCLQAAEKLIADLGWDKNEIDGLIFATQSPDYILPATSAILQHRLGLSENCLTLDLSIGCSGYVYGMSTLASYMQGGMVKKALLLVGDTISKMCSPTDQSTYPLFGDCGTCTALEYVDGAESIKFHLASDGSGYKAIIVNDGGYRNPFSELSLMPAQVDTGINRNNLQLALDGMDVFSFGISKAPESVNQLLSKFDIDKEKVDYFFFHQANLMMNERIRKKLQLTEDKVPYSLKNFGNTSSATIPLTMVTQAAGNLQNGTNNIIACGFGVGLSWATMYCQTRNLTIPALITYE